MTLLLRLIVAILPTVAFVPAAEAAPIVYFYQGNPLETTGVYHCPPVCSISGSFTLASELEANRPIELPLTPLWFSFSNGLDTATPASVTSGGGGLFHVSTDADGAIEEWVIQLALQSTTTSYIRTWNTPSGFHFDVSPNGQNPIYTADRTFASACTATVCGPIGIAFNSNNPGTWTSDVTVLPAPVPEPGSMLLFGTGALLAARAARRKRAPQ